MLAFVALTPQRHFIYKHQSSPNCDCGDNVVGDVTHVILQCRKFFAGRKACVDALQRLYVPVTLTLNLALGAAPPQPTNKSLRGEHAFFRLLHDNCLRITGLFLLAIDRKIHL